MGKELLPLCSIAIYSLHTTSDFGEERDKWLGGDLCLSLNYLLFYVDVRCFIFCLF